LGITRAWDLRKIVANCNLGNWELLELGIREKWLQIVARIARAWDLSKMVANCNLPLLEGVLCNTV